MRLLHLGFGSWVRPEEILLIEPAGKNNKYAVYQGGVEIKSAVLLRNGDLVPGYHGPRTIINHWQRVMRL